MIERLNDQVAYNPVREHIHIGFKTVLDKGQQLQAIVDDLLEQDFDPALSRALIFVRTRKLAEEFTDKIAESLNGKFVPWADKVGFFHAGMDSTDREENYEDFQQGKKVILVATKAFGMGMDIPNIHYVYHLGPSSTFEDFLQEVGRAGRNKEKLKVAGFSAEKPIKTNCVLIKDDFRKLKDLNHDSAISWNDVKNVQKVIFSFVNTFQSLAPNPQDPFPLPFDLLGSEPQFEDKFDKDGLFRLSLYWLERLERIRLGLFTPAFLPIKITEADSNFLNIKSADERKSVMAFTELIKAFKAEKFPDKDAVIIPMPDLRRFAGSKNHFELFKFLFLAQKSKAIAIERFINLEPTDLRAAEIKKLSQYREGLTIEATFALAEKILNSSKLCNQVSFSGDFLDSLIREVADECFVPYKVIWKEYTKKSQEERSKEEICKKLKEDFVKKRFKFAFNIITMLPKIRHRSIIQPNDNRKKGEVINLIYNGNTKKEQWLKPLKSLRTDLSKFVGKIASNFNATGNKSVNYVQLLIELEEEEFDYLPNIIFLSKALAYFKGGGSLIPMGVELFIDDISDINETDRSSKDYQVFQEFQEGIQLKELRLLALECLSTLNRSKQDAFIKNYFSCSASSELVGLLEEQFGEDHPNLKAFRKEALSREEAKLNEQQRQVYDAPINVNLQVIAGPGSGKTHTLTLRVARLIQNEQVNPNQILILAYNRAVVVELKDRLTKLFKELGYSSLINRLKVFTFHGFCKFCLEQELDGVEFDAWVPTFLKKMKENPGSISNKLGSIKYVFVDEFQDITTKRLELLEKIAHPEKVQICVIGDPNQSIYGYQRINDEGAMSPKPYYEQFNKLYKPKELHLSVNYRSLPDILTAAEELLNRNTLEFDIPKLKAHRVPENEDCYCEILNFKEEKINWKEKLQDLLEEEYEQDKQYRQVAILYRSNEEVFKAFNDLQDLNLEGIRVRIQGASTSPLRSREFFHFIQIYKEKGEARITASFIADFEAEKSKVLSRNSNWDAYLINLFHCLLLEFQVEKSDDSTWQDLIEFVEDITGSDDGHFAKIFDKYINEIGWTQSVREIVITTMHKVKGVEFDAVIIPPSFSDFESREDPASVRFRELVEEERRLLYVAYTRARYRLVVIKYDRELAIDNNHVCVFSADLRKRLGVVVSQEIDKLFISWGAKEFNKNSFDVVKDKVSVGDPVVLVKDDFGGWEVRWNNIKIGKLKSKVLSHTIQHSNLKGFNISSIVCYTLAESKGYDERHGTNYTQDNWGPTAKARGYIYLVDFSGYGQG